MIAAIHVHPLLAGVLLVVLVTAILWSICEAKGWAIEDTFTANDDRGPL